MDNEIAQAPPSHERLRCWVALGLLYFAHPTLRLRLRLPELDPATVMEGDPEDLERRHSLRPAEARAIFSGDFPDRADKEISAAGRIGAKLLAYEDPSYPPALRHLIAPPAYLYVLGDPGPPDAVAIVGSRRATPYGLRMARLLGGRVAGAGLTVVSGLARGIDTAAHAGALASGGRTAAVLGSGIDVRYPKENAGLFDRIARQGAVISEFPLGSPPQPYHFPVRNRIIAAMSEAVVVVEATHDSGSLITARWAIDDLGVAVGAVPGFTSARTSEGCNELLYDGATPVRELDDVLGMLSSRTRMRLEERRVPGPQAPRDPDAGEPEGLTLPARRLLKALSADEPKGPEELARSLKLASGALLGHLLELEVRGLAVQLPGGRFLRTH